MFSIKAGTVIQIEAPKNATYFNTAGWIPYTTKEDKIYDKEEVWDMVSVYNDADNIPMWVIRNITEHNNVIIHRSGKFAMCKPHQITFLD